MANERRYRKHSIWSRAKSRNPHLTWFGETKRSYSSKENAERVIREGFHRFEVKPYQCQVCNWWHLGSPHRVEYLWNMPERDIGLFIEVGERVAHCLRLENVRSVKFREDQITQRVKAIQRRLWQTDRGECA